MGRRSRNRNRRDSAFSVVTSPGAPQAEQFDAMSELQRGNLPTSGDVAAFMPLVELAREQANRERMLKAAKTLDRDGLAMRKPKPLQQQSVDVDGFQVLVSGEYYQRSGILSFETMRGMVHRAPILSAIINTRVRQIQQFCKPAGDRGVGFRIAHRDKDHELSDAEQQSVQWLTKFVANCGWEFDPRKRKMLKRDTLPVFMAKLARDSLILDAGAIETITRQDRNRGIEGFHAIDGATVRLCTDDGYDGQDQYFAVQVVNERVVTAYSYFDLIYEPRNALTDISSVGYGFSELEDLVQTVTGFINAFNYNNAGFDKNSIPKGLLHLIGDHDAESMAAFKIWWEGSVRGVNNAWALPILTSKNAEAKASFERFGVDFNEMLFSKWMTFLGAIACAIYGMSPEEINFESFSAGKSALSGSDTEERLAHSADKGLRPFLSHWEQVFSDFLITPFGENWEFSFSGLDEEDEDRQWEKQKMAATWNELRQELGRDPIRDDLGDAPLNPSLIGPWLQMQQMAQQGGGDFGVPPDDEGGESEGGQGDQFAQEQDQQGEEPQGQGAPDGGDGFGGSPEESRGFGLAKAMPIYVVD